MEPLLDFSFTHYTTDCEGNLQGSQIDVKKNKTTIKQVLDQIVKFYKKNNPTRQILNVSISGNVIAASSMGKLKVVAILKEEDLFAPLFRKYGGEHNKACVRIIFSAYVYFDKKRPCCGCTIS